MSYYAQELKSVEKHEIKKKHEKNATAQAAAAVIAAAAAKVRIRTVILYKTKMIMNRKFRRVQLMN